MNRSICARLDRLDRAQADREPVLPTTCILVGLDGSATVEGNHYQNADAAMQANPSPSGDYVIMETVDARRTPEVPLDAA